MIKKFPVFNGTRRFITVFKRARHCSLSLGRWNQLTNSKDQSSSCKANSHLASQEFLRLLWNLEVRYPAHNSPPLVPVLNQINPVHIPHLISYRYIPISLSHLRLDLPSGLFPSGLPTKILYSFLHFVTRLYFAVRFCYTFAQTPSRSTTPCRLSVTAYSINSQLPPISGDCLLHSQPEDSHSVVTGTHITWGFWNKWN
jgi:hypothetical protein